MSKAEATGTLDPKDKPLPPNGRPGTSGTELGLRANREKASSAFQRAQRAEQAYRAKRRATYAKNDIKAGMVYSLQVVRAGPAVFSEGVRVKRNAQKQKREAKRREKAAEKKRKLEEAIKKAEKAAGDEAGSAKAPAA